MKNYLLFILAFSSVNHFYSQSSNQESSFGKHFIANVSGTYIYESDNIYHKHHETTISAQASMSVTKSIYLGVQVLSIFTSGTQVNSDTYFLKGGFVQYDFLPKRKERLFIEASYNIGDYCTCGNNDPYKASNINYIGYGGGADFPISKSRFSASISIMLFRISNPIPKKYNYNIYKLGVSYNFGKKHS